MTTKEANVIKASKSFGTKPQARPDDSPDMVVEDAITACEKGLAEVRREHYQQATKFAKEDDSPTAVLERIYASDDLDKEERGYIASVAWWRMIEDNKDQEGLDGLKEIYRKCMFASEKERESARAKVRSWDGPIGVFIRLAANETISNVVPNAPDAAPPIKIFERIMKEFGKREIEGAKNAIEASKSMTKFLEKYLKKLEKRAKGIKDDSNDKDDDDILVDEEEDDK